MTVIGDNGLLCWSADSVHLCFREGKLILNLFKVKFIFRFILKCPHRLYPSWNFCLLFLGGVPETVRSKVRCQEVDTRLVTLGREFRRTWNSWLRNFYCMYMYCMSGYSAQVSRKYKTTAGMTWLVMLWCLIHLFRFILKQVAAHFLNVDMHPVKNLLFIG